ncbi:toxin-antitoxin system HicB family antitoxin [Brevibacillus sp. LEMMJ03]|nr:toxin-antitoxin system HicB family antitoxin [Brevibacillus sp. LEMMJ03]TRY24435.1 toxin-antitoxin system HicB family antitoxin [Brevibacillus sp. LEMMJ03]
MPPSYAKGCFFRGPRRRKGLTSSTLFRSPEPQAEDSGKINLRMPTSLHRPFAVEAEWKGHRKGRQSAACSTRTHKQSDNFSPFTTKAKHKDDWSNKCQGVETE